MAVKRGLTAKEHEATFGGYYCIELVDKLQKYTMYCLLYINHTLINYKNQTQIKNILVGDVEVA